MRAISLFAGGGGFEIGFDRAGIQTVLQAESDPWCLEVLARHWPDVERVTDVRSVDAAWLQQFSDDFRRRCGSSISDRDSAVARLNGGLREPSRRNADHRADGRGAEPAWRGATDGVLAPTNGGRAEAGRGLCSDIDLIYGGWPCQDLSVAGNRAGLRGERSGLFYEFARVVRELRPRWIAAENVPGLLSSADGADFGIVLRTLVDLGYGVAWRVLDGRWFGVPQRRRRVLIVGCLGDAHRAAQVLAVCESCGGHPAPRRETGQAVAYSLAASVRGTGDGHGNAWNTTYVSGSGVDPESMRPLTERSTGYRMDYESENFLVAETVRSHPRPGSNSLGNMVAGALRASDGHHGHSSPRGDGADNLIAFDWQTQGSSRTRPHANGEWVSPLKAKAQDALSGAMGVRRLTPLECERLMAWPDDWTKYTADGREIPDSHRYRMCGNGIIATVAEWLGYRLMRAHSFDSGVAA